MRKEHLVPRITGYLVKRSDDGKTLRGRGGVSEYGVF